ncbi:MAG TPA: transcription antitermination factor NusB [Terriglobia bacterium]|nr:transcription antitermination factor NusB [Terriglobia bacterium]
MASRRKSRELALQMLFQCELGKHTPEHVLSTFLRAQKADPEVLSFARELFEGTLADIPSLDRLIGDQAANWRLERMAAVDRNLLRLALYELLHHPETPPAVVIDEALEIARRFSGDESVEFVNGVLDGIRKSLAVAKQEE